MATENERGPPSTEVSPLDLQLSACAIEGQQTGRAQADVSSSTRRLAAGQLLGGRYRIERELGEGGMGVVYLAADEQVPGERFAIKLLKEELRPEALALLREEVRKTRKLSHPNIVDVHSVNVDGQKLYLLMEYLEGQSLDKLLDEEFGRGMSFSHAWPIIEDVGAALGNAHDHNVIHSDLKPANVFLTNSGILREHAAQGVVLLAGDSHARRDIGVPSWFDPPTLARVFAVAFLERGDPAPPPSAFDAVVTTDAASRPDQCATLRPRKKS